LRVFVGQLRNKIERDPSAPEIIRTESGIGYRFSEGVQAPTPNGQDTPVPPRPQ
jgi:hypothetical protein